MIENLSFIKNSLAAVSELNRSESLSDGEIIIDGVKKSVFLSKRVCITITRSKASNQTSAHITARINKKIRGTDISKILLYDLLNQAGILDSKLKMKLNLLFEDVETEITFKDGQIKKVVTNDGHVRLKDDVAELIVLGYREHLMTSFPTLANNVNIEFVNNSHGRHIRFIQNLSWDNYEWKNFVVTGICLKSALDNCESCGIEKIVFVCGNEFEDIAISQLRRIDGVAS